jgi:hypothetical protein
MDAAPPPLSRAIVPSPSYTILKLQLDCYVEQDPFIARRRNVTHLLLEPAAMSLLKNSLLLGVRLMEAETPPDVPVDDAKELGLFLYERLRKPMAKDILVTLVTRLYEVLWIQVFMPDVLTASKVVRGARRERAHYSGAE